MLRIKQKPFFKTQKFFSIAIAAVVAVGALVASEAMVSARTQKQTESHTINPWWPIADAKIQGSQPFKADVPGLHPSQYTIHWQVDGGTLNVMPDNYEHYPHKEVLVDISPWSWRGVGPYEVSYVAKDAKGAVIATKSFNIYNAGASDQTSVEAPQVETAVSTTSTVDAASEPVVSSAPGTGALSGKTLYAEVNSSAMQQLKAWVAANAQDESLLQKIAGKPQTKWLGGWNHNIEQEVRDYTSSAHAVGAIPAVVAYNIPQRDCGSYSAGGVSSADQYGQWIQSIARGIGQRQTLVILEPDAISGWDCLNSTDRGTRQEMLKSAISTLKQNSAAIVYLDAGHAKWHSAEVTAERLRAAGVETADGFSLNVSNFITTEENITFGTAVSSKVGGKHFVIDTSRNGTGPAQGSEWCNPFGRGLGQAPTTSTDNNLVDAYLWVKTPGESDGTCNGGPSAGSWWPQYALELARNAR